MDLHPYDDVERRYRHTDTDPAEGVDIVTHILGLPEPPSNKGLLYDLSLYSGGIGILDRLAISMAATPKVWTEVTATLNACEAEDAAQNVAWAEDFLWLINGGEQALSVREAAIKFVNSMRRDFQEECKSSGRLLFQSGSDVNGWAVIWGKDTCLNYFGYSQG